MKTLLALLVVLGACSAAYGLRCYVCEGHDVAGQDDDCEDYFEKSEHGNLLQTCAPQEKFCRKRKQGINKVWTKITRSCAEQCEDRNTAAVDRVDCCKGDGCNGAGTLMGSFVLLCGAYLLKHIF